MLGPEKVASLRDIITRIEKTQRVNHGQAVRMLADMVDRSPGTVKRWLSVKPDGTPYPFPVELLALARARIAGKM